jgi:hypothetical protein
MWPLGLLLEELFSLNLYDKPFYKFIRKEKIQELVNQNCSVSLLKHFVVYIDFVIFT